MKSLPENEEGVEGRKRSSILLEIHEGAQCIKGSTRERAELPQGAGNQAAKSGGAGKV